MDGLDARRAKLRRAEAVAADLQAAKTALIGYAASYRDLHADQNFGHLPCPDTTGSGIGKTPCGQAGQMAIGLFPHKTLGLPQLRDADGNCFWYAVAGRFKSNPKALPLNWDTQGEFEVRSAAGTILGTPDDANGGVAALVIAPGSPLPGQRRTAPGCSVPPEQARAYLEPSGASFTASPATDSTGTLAVNDRAVWVTPHEIFEAVTARGDFARFINDGIAALASALGTLRPASQNGLLPAVNPFARQAAAFDFYDGWKDQFRYLRCQHDGCYADAAGNRYSALLLFGGRSVTGRPRPGTGRRLSDHFESALALAEGREFAPCAADPVSFDNSSAAARAADMALCLSPYSP
ncbi:MAG TPA: hypothetical protein VF801_14070 [Rhodocyclaceae bacterium]